MNYIDNEDFLNDILNWKALLKKDENASIPDAIAQKIKQLAEHIIKRPNFSNYTYKEKMISDAIYICLKYGKNFNPKISSKPFAYFSQLVWSSFIQTIKKENKVTVLKKAMLDKMYFDFMAEHPIQNKDEICTDFMFSSDYRAKDHKESFSPVVVIHDNKKYKFDDEKEYLKFSKKLSKNKI